MPVYTGVQNKASISAIQVSVRTLNGATAMYHANNGSFPTGDAATAITALTGSTAGGPYLQALYRTHHLLTTFTDIVGDKIASGEAIRLSGFSTFGMS